MHEGTPHPTLRVTFSLGRRPQLKLISDRELQNRVVLEIRNIVVDLLLLRGDVVLDAWGCCDVPANRPYWRAGARTPCQRKSGLRRPMKSHTNLHRIGEVSFGSQISISKRQQRSKFLKRERGIAMDRIRSSAEVRHVAKRKALSSRHGYCGVPIVSIPDQCASAREESRQQIFVELDVHRAQSRIRRIVCAVLGEGGLVRVKIETTADIRPMRQWFRHLNA